MAILAAHAQASRAGTQATGDCKAGEEGDVRMTPLTIASLDQELQCAYVQFDFLNENRHVYRDNGLHLPPEQYRVLDPDTEARITLLGERIAAMLNIRAHMQVKSMLTQDANDATRIT